MVEYRLLDFLGFPGYRVGNDGSVWSRWRTEGRGDGGGRGVIRFLGEDWKRLKPCHLTKSRHQYVDLCFDGGRARHLIHRLVLLAFVGSCPEGMECRHFPDRDSTNNRLGNLQWGTRSDNHRDAFFHGTACLKGERSGRSKLTEDEVRLIRKFYKKREVTLQSLADRFGVGIVAIHGIVHRKTWGHVE